MNGNTFACGLVNYCIFQGVTPPEYYPCDTIRVPCSEDGKNDDGTFICEYHLSKFFMMEKMVLEIPSGMGKSFKTLIGKTLIQQDDQRRIMIPTKQNFKSVLKVDFLSTTERYVIYKIYDQKDDARRLCEDLKNQDYFSEELWSQLSSIVDQILGRTNPDDFCRTYDVAYNRIYTSKLPEVGLDYEFPLYPPPIPNDENEQARLERIDRERRELQEGGPGQGAGSGADPVAISVFGQLSPFLKNLVRKLIRPQLLIIDSKRFLLERNPSVIFVYNAENPSENGISAPAMYNPVKPRVYRNLKRESVYKLITILEFDGRATKQQQALSTYEVYTIARPLFYGIEKAV